jgi:hypothetical protein
MTYLFTTQLVVVPEPQKQAAVLFRGRYHKLTRDKLTASFAAIVKLENAMKRYILVFSLALVGLNAHAALHKWVDADGNVHYSDTVPPEATATQTVRNVSGKGPADAPASFSPKSLAEREAEMKKSKHSKEEASQKKEQQDAVAENKNRNCAAARENARTLEESPRIVTYDANGERTYMDDEARAKKLEESRQTISNNCN